jgi:hypothetical protein
MRIVSALLTATGFLSAANPPAHDAWRWEQVFQVPEAGVVRLDVPPGTLDVAQASLADLRVLAPDGVETPRLVDNPAPVMPERLEAEGTEIRLIESGPNVEAATQLEFGTGTGQPVEAVTLRSPAREFIKSATIEGTADGDNWQVIAAREVVFRQASGPERMTVPLPAKPWKKLKVTLSDARSRPIPLTGAGIAVAVTRQVTAVPAAVKVVDNSAAGNTSTLRLDLGAANLHLREVRLKVEDPVFSRRCTLRVGAEGGKASAAPPVGGGMIYRVVGEGGDSTGLLSLPVNRRIPTRLLVLVIENGDSPPLTISGMEADRYPTTLEFHAAKPGAWLLVAGNPQAAEPAYDLGPLRAALASAPGQRLVPGGLRPREGYRPPVALPGVDPAGAEIDLSEWTRRSAVRIPGTGVVAIEVKAAQLAASRTDHADFRLVQNGRQLPYLIEPRKVERRLPCGIEDLGPDPKRRTVSCWRFTQPVAGLPADQLVLSSPMQVFTRTMTLVVRKLDTSRPYDGGWMTSGVWTRTPGNEADFRLDLGDTRLPGEWRMETDNGDNPAIGISGAEVVYHAPVIVAKLVSADPLHLYYGNPRAVPPEYDLGLVRAELSAATKQQAELLGDEPFRGEKSRPAWLPAAGSPWLWGALALVVVVLLVVVAKLLPKAADDA